MGYNLKTQSEWIKQGRGLSALDPSKKQEERLRFHLQELNKPEAGAFNAFKAYVKSILPSDKYETFKQTITYPLPTVDFSNDLINSFKAIFRGNNKYFGYDFTENELSQDFEEYLNEIKCKSTFESSSFEAFKYYINSIVVIDMPQEVSSPPKPYFYFKKICDIKAINIDNSGNFDFVAFEENDRIITIDDEKYISIPVIDKKPNYALAIENKHKLGFIPSKWFWTDNIKGVLKSHPLSKELGKLDTLLFKSIASDVADLYIPFPIIQTPETECDYTDERGLHCNGGFLVNEDNNYSLINNSILECPKCGNHKLTGPGSNVRFDQGDEKITEIKFISAPTEGVKYYSEKIEYLKDSISFYATGRQDFKNDTAKNEKQILGSFETQTNVLLSVKSNFESCYRFIIETIASLRYSNNFKSATINFGTEFMLRSLSELYDLYSVAKEQGLSPTLLDMIQNQIIDTEYQHNEVKRARIRFLNELEPFRHYTLKEVIENSNNIPVDQVDLVIKQNFSNFVQRWERERFNIMDFAEGTPLKNRVNIILTEFKKYANEIITSTIAGSTGATS